MSREFEAKVPTQMFHAGCNAFMEISQKLNVHALDAAFRAMCAHSDFQRQLRAWAAEEMRRLVPEKLRESEETSGAYVWNTCRAETLANITAWEKANEGQ